MTEPTGAPYDAPIPEPTPPSRTPQANYGAPMPAPAYAVGYQVGAPGAAPIGRVRGTGVVILLTIYQVHEEMKQHKGSGLGGVIALLLAFFVGIVMP